MWKGAMTPVGFEPTQLALVELESTPLRPLGQSVSIGPRHQADRTHATARGEGGAPGGGVELTDLP